MKKYEIDMCTGSLPKKMLLFAVPLVLSGVLQLLFNAVDLVVVGRYVGDSALAAVGSTAALINLITNLFIGLSVGANVLVARYVGSKSDRDTSETVHTAIFVSVLCGLFLAIVGICYARPMLELMDTTPEAIDQAVLYMRIYFFGMPVMMLYNFGSAILRAIGDTRRPLYYLTISGFLNAGMNMFFVIVLHRGVDGVAYATVLSQLLAAVLVLNNLCHSDTACRFSFRQMHIYQSKLLAMSRIGLPAGFQGCIFSLSNVVIQSSVNSFGTTVMSGNTAAQSIEGFVYVAMNAFHHTALSFTGQNYGAGKYRRIPKILLWSLLFVTITGLLLGGAVVFGETTLLSLYTNSKDVLHYGCVRLEVICTLYFTCGTMDVVVGSLRGLGYSIIPMLVSLLGVCGFRLIWIFTAFANNHTLQMLYISYPISWIATTLAHLFVYLLVARKMLRRKALLQTK